MIGILRAELRKLLTVRSTYAWVLIAALLSIGLMGFWAYGYKDAQHAALNVGALDTVLRNAVNVTGLFLAFITVLLVGHEYRYNTILYSLTSANNRLKVLFGKWLVSTLFILVAAAVLIALSAIAFFVGQRLAGVTTLHQTMPGVDFYWQAVVSVAGMATYAFLITVLLRSLVGAIVFVLAMPTTVESLLSLLIKDNAKYLPYTALDNLTSSSLLTSSITSSVLIVAGYVVIVGAVAAVLFVRRDAN